MPTRPSPLSPEELAASLTSLPGWEGDSGGIHRTVEADNFATAIELVQRVAAVAEGMDHHPDIDIRWRKVSFTLTTHDAGAVTSLDTEQASRIDAIARELGAH